MVLTTGTASALIGGSSRKLPPPKMVDVEIVRGVFIDGKVCNPGDVMEVTVHEAAHLVAIGKAKKAVPPPAQEETSTEEPVKETKRMGRKAKPRGETDGSD